MFVPKDVQDPPKNLPLRVVNSILENPSLFPPKDAAADGVFRWEEPPIEKWSGSVAVILQGFQLEKGDIFELDAYIVGKNDNGSNEEKEADHGSDEEKEADHDDSSSEGSVGYVPDDVIDDEDGFGVDSEQPEDEGAAAGGSDDGTGHADSEEDETPPPVGATGSMDERPEVTGKHSRGSVESPVQVWAENFSSEHI